MKIRIIKDIPGYRVGEYELDDVFLSSNEEMEHCYVGEKLIKEGWAEEIEELDIKDIRARYMLIGKIQSFSTEYEPASNHELKWFQSYRIVEAVIEKLNGDWDPNENSDQRKFTMEGWDFRKKEISTDFFMISPTSMLPLMKSHEVRKKVIELCEPELKVLFGFK